MEVLFRDLSPADQGMVVDELTKLAIAIEYDRTGSILVPGNKVAEARARLATAKKLPTTGHMGYGDLGGIGIMNTPGVERDRRKAIIEGELARTIETIDGVGAARVHLNLAERSPFSREEANTSASVIVTEKAGAEIGQEQAQAIRNLVLYSVERLDPKHITIVSSTGQTLIDGMESENAGGVASTRITTENTEAKRRELALQRKLDLVFGRGNTIVSVPLLEMNFDERNVQERENTPSEAPKSVESMSESMTADDQNSGAGAGLSANLPGAGPGTTANKSQNYKTDQKSLTYETNERVSQTKRAPGNLVKMAINVMVDKKTVKDVTAVTKMVQAELGPLALDTENFTATVTATDFDTKARDDEAKSAADSKSASQKQQLLSLLPVGALIFVGLMVIKALAKVSKSSNVLVAAGPNGQMVTMNYAAVPGSAAVQMPNGDYVNPDGTVITQEALEAGTAALPPGASVYGDGPNVVGSSTTSLEITPPESQTIAAIPERVNVQLEQIKVMSIDRPEKVAMLIKGWLLEESK